MTPIAKHYLPARLEQEDLLRRIINSIRQTLDLQDILTTTVAEVRCFLRTDRVKIYKFHSDGSGQVIAESICDRKLPSLLGLNFPADDIPSHARELFVKSRMRSVVNVDTRQIGQSHLHDLENGETRSEDICLLPSSKPVPRGILNCNGGTVLSSSTYSSSRETLGVAGVSPFTATFHFKI